MSKRDWYTAKEVRTILGVGSTWFDLQVKSGAIKVVQPTKNTPRRVPRAELVRLCLQMKVPTETMRRHLNDGRCVLTCGLPADFRTLTAAGLPCQHTNNLFDFGRRIDAPEVWAAVAHLPTLGKFPTLPALAEWSELADRPFLVAIADASDADCRPFASEVCDIVWPATQSPRSTVEMLTRLRRSEL